MAEDLAQEAMMNAWRARGSFAAGTNLKAWVFTILRNAFYSQGRRAWRQAHWDEESANRLEGPPNKQDWSVELSDTVRAMSGLPDTQREAIILIGAGGFSYEEAARICGTAVGTMKSRVARGRVALLSTLDGHEPLPQLPAERSANPADDILSQMNALTDADARREAHA
jgi:RNA polymerase sigma-70 factor (ECF subfamily)